MILELMVSVVLAMDAEEPPKNIQKTVTQKQVAEHYEVESKQKQGKNLQVDEESIEAYFNDLGIVFTSPEISKDLFYLQKKYLIKDMFNQENSPNNQENSPKILTPLQQRLRKAHPNGLRLNFGDLILGKNISRNEQTSTDLTHTTQNDNSAPLIRLQKKQKK